MSSFALHLANLAEAKGVDLANGSVRTVVCSAETLSAAKREKLARQWGAEIYDVFGMSEAGLMGAEASEHDGIHIWSDMYFCEVVDPDSGEQLPDGEVGTFCVIPLLTNHATPFLRWNSGDMVSMHDHGTSDGPFSELFPMIRHAHRTTGFFKVRGINVNHAEFEDFIFRIPRCRISKRFCSPTTQHWKPSKYSSRSAAMRTSILSSIGSAAPSKIHLRFNPSSRHWSSAPLPNDSRGASKRRGLSTSAPDYQFAVPASMGLNWRYNVVDWRDAVAVQNLQHYALTVPDVSAGKRFYEDFGLTCHAEGDQAIFRCVGRDQDQVVLAEGPERKLHHICFGTSEEGLGSIKDKCRGQRRGGTGRFPQRYLGTGPLD